MVTTKWKHAFNFKWSQQLQRRKTFRPICMSIVYNSYLWFASTPSSAIFMSEWRLILVYSWNIHYQFIFIWFTSEKSGKLRVLHEYINSGKFRNDHVSCKCYKTVFMQCVFILTHSMEVQFVLFLWAWLKTEITLWIRYVVKYLTVKTDFNINQNELKNFNISKKLSQINFCLFCMFYDKKLHLIIHE